MKLNKHIAIVVPGFPKDESDSTCLPAVQHFVRGMSKKIERITVFALHYPYSDESYTWNGVTVLPMKGNNSFWKRKFTLYKTLKTAFSHVFSRVILNG